MADPIRFVEVKQKGALLPLAALVGEIRRGLEALVSQEQVETEVLACYRLPDELTRGTPEDPWDLSPTEISILKAKFMATAECVPLGMAFDLDQGVTPGGGALGVFLTKFHDNLEPEVTVPAAEAEDLVSWKLGPAKKWLIYPYANDGTPLNLGKLEFDLDAERARHLVESLIATGSIDYPKTARYLVRHYSLLASREAEKRQWQELGKRWYEYHRPRDGSKLRRAPKILTRRMTHNFEFSLDEQGVIPTDSCIAITSKQGSEWGRQLNDLGMTGAEGFVFATSLLNSSLAKLLIRFSADAWKGDFYQVREDILSRIPLKMPTQENLQKFLDVIKAGTNVITAKHDSAVADRAIFRLYGVDNDWEPTVRLLRWID